MVKATGKKRDSIASGGGWELAICTGNYAQFRDVLIMQTVKLDREVVKSIKINVNAIFSLV